MESDTMTPAQSEELRVLREKEDEQRATIEELKSALRHIREQLQEVREQLQEAMNLLGAD